MTTTELSHRLAGDLYESGDPEYEDACGLFNSMVATRPRMVARCSAPEDVVAALAYAHEHGLPVAVRAGGHSVAGHSLCEGLVLDVRGLDDVEVDAQRRIARVGGGATWAAVDRATQAHGLATTGGRVSTTGVAGLTLGGGSGWLERKHGLACDNLLAVELVTAHGRTVRASDDKHPELLWALRGGGGNFGVVTALEFRLHPLGPEVTAGLALYPAAEGAALLARWGDAMRSAPAEVGLAFAYLTAPEEPFLPAELHGQTVAAIAGLYAGPPDEGERVLRPFLELATPAFDGFQPMPYVDFQCSLDDPPGCRNYWSAEHLDELPPAAVERIHACGTALPSAGSSLFVVPWGGRVADGNGPLAGRDARFVVHPLALWEDPADDERAIGWVRGLRAGLADHATGAAYLNWTGDEGRVVSAYGEANHARLALIKAEWDAGDAFVAGGHVPPAGPAAPRVTRVAGGIELAAVATGPPGGEPVVLLHGLFDHWRSFEPVLRHLSGDLRAYALTQRGHTGSSCPASGYAIADLAADVLGFLDAHGIERALLAGHSLGALAGLQAAIHAPDRVSGLVLAPGFAQARETVAVKELLQAVQEMGPELERAFAELLQEDAHTQSASFFDAMVGHTLQMPAAVCRALLESITAFDATDALERVRAPALVVWGDADAIVPRAQVEALVAGLPDAELRVYHGCGHTPHWHDSRRFARDLACFAERVAA